MDKEKQLIRRKSLILGFIPPAFSNTEFEKTDWSLDIMDGLKNRREVRKLSNLFIKSITRTVSLFEKNLLKLLDLPNIDEIRQSFIDEDKQNSAPIVGGFRDKFNLVNVNELLEYKKQLTPELENKIDQLLNSWLNAIIGAKNQNDTNDTPIYQSYILSLFNLYVHNDQKSIKNSLSNQAPVDELKSKNIIDDGVNRIQKRISREYREKIKTILDNTTKHKLNPLQIARELHKQVGEGQMWYWKRFTVSKV
jgi:hypothetical protein